MTHPTKNLQKSEIKEYLLNVPIPRGEGSQGVGKTTSVIRASCLWRQHIPNMPRFLNFRKSSIALIATVVSIITAVVGTGGAALPIVVPVAGAMYLGMLAHDLYKGA